MNKTIDILLGDLHDAMRAANPPKYTLPTLAKPDRVLGLATLARLRGECHGYDDASAERKATFHRAGMRLVLWIVQHIDRGARVNSNKAGIAVSGEVVLHGKACYAQVLYDGRGARILWRRPLDERNSVRWDNDGANKYIDLRSPSAEQQLRHMVEQFRRWETEALTGGAA